MSVDSSEELKIAIVGAGIAGLALGIGLHQKGIPFKIYEDAPQHSAIGAGIGFGPNGLLAMDLLEERFRSRYEAFCVGNKSFKDKAVFFEALRCTEGLGCDESWCGDSTWGSANYIRKSAHRKDVLEALTSFVPSETVIFSKHLVEIDQHHDRVTLHFADGETVEASVLIASDGIQSVGRKHVLQPAYPDQVEPVYAHSYAYRAVIPMDKAKEILGDLTDTAKNYVGHDRVVVTYRVSGGAEFNFLHCVYRPDEPWPVSGSVTETVSQKEMLADFENRGIDHRLLKLLEKARPIRWGLFHHIHTSTYFRGRVVLLGDSAHASLPYQGAGAGQGLEDALILSTVLSKIDSTIHEHTTAEQIQAAFQAYDAVRRPRAQRQTEQSHEATLLLNFRHPEAGSNIPKIVEKMRDGRLDWLWFHDLKQDVKLAQDKMDALLSM